MNILIYMLIFIVIVLSIFCLMLNRELLKIKELLNFSNTLIKRNENNIKSLQTKNNNTNKNINNLWKATEILDEIKLNK